MLQFDNLIKQAYAAFNARNINAVLALMDANVHWPNGWEGGYVEGHEAVRDYWTRQWKELDPHVEPVVIAERPDGRIEVKVHQLVKDLEGKVLYDGLLLHVYTFDNGLINGMEIENL